MHHSLRQATEVAVSATGDVHIVMALAFHLASASSIQEQVEWRSASQKWVHSLLRILHDEAEHIEATAGLLRGGIDD
jgi:hypothetical protein